LRPNAQLTAIIDHWGPHYLATPPRPCSTAPGFPATRWPGLKEGVVQIGPYGPKVPADVVKAAAEAVMRTGQIDGTVHIFTGPINDHTGAEKRCRPA
jgi:basic membrane protein A